MKKTTKRLFALLLVLTMLVGLLPTIAFAREANNEAIESQQEELQAIPTGASDDLWEAITALENEKIVNVRGKNATSEDYAKLVDQIIRMVEASDSFREGSIERHGDFFYWVTTDGQVNGYSPRLRAEVRATGNAEADPEAYAGIETVSFAPKGGTTTSKNVAVFQPYYGIDSSFTTQYADEGTSIAQATGGSNTTYKTTNATITNIGSALDTCGVVIFDSHGDTDYASGSDYTSRANTSYLCLQSNTGLTTADQAQATGTYGTYYHAYYAGSNGSMKYYCVDGTAISNHMTGTSPNNLLWMAICLGMATDGMHAPIRAKGVEVTYGYSQSVSFTGDYLYEEYFFDYLKDGKTVAQGASYMKSKYKNMDTYVTPYAYPIFVSSEDTYPGHGNVDAVQSVYSTWVLLGGETYTVNATSNNTSWGTVSVNGYNITASPANGYYAAGYTVTSGTATVTQNGNVFTVSPSSNCTVQINFAARTTATVNFVASGVSEGSQTAYTGDAITLPTTISNTVEGWTFAGWMAQQINETTTKPTYYAPGASYTVNANATLYALYTRVENDGSGEVVYQLASGLENGGKYILVDQGSISGTTGYAVGNTVVTSNHYLTPVSVTISDDICTASSANLAKVVWEASASGSGFTLYNTAVSKYMGLDSSEYLYPSATGVAWAYTSEGYLDNQIDSEGYYYLSYSSDSTVRYTTSKSGSVINLYQETNSATTYYWTDPVEIEPEDFTVTFTTPAGVTAPAPMVMDNVTGGTLPTAGAPDGYTFLGWVVADYDNVTERPAQILTGTYKPTADITLKALYTYSVSGGSNEPTLTQMTTSDTFADGDKIVITAYGTEYALYQQTANNNYVANYTFTNNAATIAADEKNWLTVTAADGGWYLGDDTNGYLYNSSSNYLYANSNKSVWTLTTRNGYLALTTNSRYLACRTDLTTTNANLWRMVSATATNGVSTLVIYKLTEGPADTVYYTTIINAAHEHTPAAAVVENNVEPSCTVAGGYDNVVYCSECGEELSREHVTVAALGHDFDILVDEIEPTCTETGLQEYKCIRCDATDLVEIDALGHLPGTPVQENYVNPTTTSEGGYDMVVYCQRCNTELDREHTVLPAIVAEDPIETDALHIYSSISVGTDMVVTFTARKNDLTDYNNFWIEVVKKNPDGDVTYTYAPEEMTEGTSTWTVQFKNIFAKEMGLDVEARLYAENAAGQVYMSPVRNANIRDYLGGRLTATNNSVEQRVLAADMLNYGAAAQMFTDFLTDHLVNEELTAEQLAKLAEYETTELPLVEKTNYNTRPEGQSNILFTSVTLGNEVLLNLTIRLAEGTEGVQVLVKNHATGAVVTTLDTTFLGSTFNATFNGIGADAMRTEFDLVTVVNGVETGNIRTWSVEAYVGEIRTEGIALKVAMGNALLTYGDSAAAYFAAQ